MKHLSCVGCWWLEGGRCYLEPCEREPDGQSKKLAKEACDSYKGKRAMLSQVIPNEKLVIFSENNPLSKPVSEN
jgi:hypothetical protein